MCTLNIILFFQLRGKECELDDCQKRLSTAECDVQHFEQENKNLHQKVEILCKAAESPRSKLALTRILERYFPIVNLYILNIHVLSLSLKSYRCNFINAVVLLQQFPFNHHLLSAQCLRTKIIHVVPAKQLMRILEQVHY